MCFGPWTHTARPLTVAPPRCRPAGVDGYSIFEALQQECPGKFRVVFTTVHGSETEQLRGLEAGAMDYMVKPMSLRVALEKIRRWVGR